MYAELYPPGHDNFALGGLPLVEAFGVAARVRLDEASTMILNIPNSSRNCADVVYGAVVRVDGQLYVINGLSDGITENGVPFKRAVGQHIFWYVGERKHLPKKFKVGAPAWAILAIAFNGVAYGSNTVRQLSPSELNELGLVEIMYYVDIDRDKVNPLEVVDAVQSHVNGELYVDNFTFALVRQLGRDSGVMFTLDRNARSIERTIDTTALVTRLYPYGKGNLEITSVHGQAFIDSPNINDYPLAYEGHMDFPDYDEPSSLLQRALKEFAPNNPFRIDRPRVTYHMNVVDL